MCAGTGEKVDDLKQFSWWRTNLNEFNQSAHVDLIFVLLPRKSLHCCNFLLFVPSLPRDKAYNG